MYIYLYIPIGGEEGARQEALKCEICHESFSQSRYVR
jgi:hypothetical protein